MNDLQLIQAAKNECMPRIAEAVSKIRRVFPKFQIKPSTLERNPSADTLVTSKIEPSGCGTRLVDDYINVATQQPQKRMTIQACNGEPAAVRTFKCEEFNAEGKPTLEIHNDSEGYAYALEHSYDSAGNHIQTRKYMPMYSEEEIMTYKGGKEVCNEINDINPRTLVSEPKTKIITNSDGSKVRTNYQRCIDPNIKIMIENVEETNPLGKVVRRHSTIDGKPAGTVEFNPETELVTRFEIPESYRSNRWLKVEYEPDKWGTCKSVRIEQPDTTTTLYEAKYENGKVVDINGFYLDALKKRHGDNINEIAKIVDTPRIVDNKVVWNYHFDGGAPFYVQPFHISQWRDEIIKHNYLTCIV